MLKYLAASSDTARGKMDVSLKTLAARVGFACERGGLGGWRSLKRPYFLAYYDCPPSREGRNGENRGRVKRQTAQTEGGRVPKRGGAAASSLSREREREGTH